MATTTKATYDIREKPILKHFLIQEIIFVASTIIFMNLNMERIIGLLGNIEYDSAYGTIIMVFAVLSGAITPILVLLFCSGLFYLYSVFRKFEIDFKIIFKIACIANYVNLTNMIFQILASLTNVSVLKLIGQYHIIDLIYMIAFFELLLRTVSTKSEFNWKKERTSYSIFIFIFWTLTSLISFVKP